MCQYVGEEVRNPGNGSQWRWGHWEALKSFLFSESSEPGHEFSHILQSFVTDVTRSGISIRLRLGKARSRGWGRTSNNTILPQRISKKMPACHVSSQQKGNNSPLRTWRDKPAFSESNSMNSLCWSDTHTQTEALNAAQWVWAVPTAANANLFWRKASQIAKYFHI